MSFLSWLRQRLSYVRETPRMGRLEVRLDLLLRMQTEHQRELRMMYRALTEPPAELWLNGPPRGPTPEGLVFPHSTVCRQESLEQDYFHGWMDALQIPAGYHRKHWEFAFILQALKERGALRPGARGLGFGVGKERLTAYLASQGCSITATDLDEADAANAGWTQGAAHAATKQALRFAALCPDPVFEANVEFRVCDMNAIPEDLEGYDFCWSACALEHLGSIEKGMAFIERSLRCLRPNGIAIHTTELNLDSDADTVEEGGTVLFRRRDLEALRCRLAVDGWVMAPLDLAPGVGPIDRYIDVAPYRAAPHLRLALEGYSATSVGLIIQAPAS